MEDINNTSANPPQQSTLQFTLNIIFFIIIIALLAAGYIYGNFDGVSKSELQSSYVKKDALTFYHIPYKEQDKYIPVKEHLKQIEEIRVKKEKPIKEIVYKESKPKVVEKIVYKEKTIQAKPTKEIIYQNIKSGSSSFDTFRCYGMPRGSYYLTKECEENLDAFLEKNREAKYFEVIAVEDDTPFRTLRKLGENIDMLKGLDITKDNLDFVHKCSKNGLDKLRVNETIWNIKKKLGLDTLAVPVSYKATSKEENRGTVVRAYR